MSSQMNIILVLFVETIPKPMGQHHIPDGLAHEVWQLYAGGHTTDEIKSRLLKREYDPEMVDEVVLAVREMRWKKKRSQGLILTRVGAVVLVLAFVTTYILSINGYPTSLALYGLTTVGIGLLFTGMVLYFG
jgi:hypothetical protein